MSVWRPPSVVRPIAIGVVRRGDELLLMVVRSDDGAIKGYRPLGGSIEFGERAADALKREFAEELGLATTELSLLTVLENLYMHHGATGHEIAFVFEAAFADDSAYRREGFSYEDGGVRNPGRGGGTVPGRAAWPPHGKARLIHDDRFSAGTSPADVSAA